MPLRAPADTRRMPWDPAQYLKFADQRLRPAVELLARVRHDGPRSVFDLGCGPGNSTRLLRERWPSAHLTGVDGSSEMLERASRDAPETRWLQADLTTWRPPRGSDVLFSNATYQWMGDHEHVFPDLFHALAPGGSLAVQMPRNFGAPSHLTLREVARAGSWRARLEPLIRDTPVAAPRVYYDLLSGLGASVDVWETEYLHVLTGPDPVLEWVRGSALRPLLAALDEAERAELEERYAALLRSAYPARPDGVTIFPFKRLFFVATRG